MPERVLLMVLNWLMQVNIVCCSVCTDIQLNSAGDGGFEDLAIGESCHLSEIYQ